MNSRETVVNGKRTLVRALAVLALAALFRPGAAEAATHYPTGAYCSNCHAISETEMVAGTRLIRKTSFLNELINDPNYPWATGSNVPCLFCHREGPATSTEMRRVENHFSSDVVSSHNARKNSAFTNDDQSSFDCLDCHVGLSSYVVADGLGNARIHGIDAKTQNVDILATLRHNGTVPTAANYTSMCMTSVCHNGAGNIAYDTLTARKAHTNSTARVSVVGDTAKLANCNSCHSTHRSIAQDGLVVLLTNGNVDPQNGSIPINDPLRVTPDKCNACHTYDEVSSSGVIPFSADGHGKSGITLVCTNCHNPAVPHPFTKDAVTTSEKRRFINNESSAPDSTIRQPPEQNSAYSICLTCHSTMTGKIHMTATDDPALAGCNDCHEPHGNGVTANLGDGDGIVTNIMMMRRVIPRVDASGVSVYGDGSAPYDAVHYTGSVDTYRSDGRGICDVSECHAGITRKNTSIQIWPLSSFMTGDQHSQHDQTAGSSPGCISCHKHNDSGGAWAANQSCTTCHGQPPVGTTTTAEGYTTFLESRSPHKRHASAAVDGGYGIPCGACHRYGTDPVYHDTTTKTFQSVFFNTSSNPSGSYDTGTYTCSGLYCHSDGAGTPKAATWNANNWDTQNLACSACHGGIDAGATRIATGVHSDHLGFLGRSAAITCANCHAGTVTTIGTDATTEIPSDKVAIHANGTRNVLPGGSFNGATVGFSWVGGSCSNVSCHGAWKDIAWNATANRCDNCHGTFQDAGGMDADVVPKHRNADWTKDFSGGHTGAADDGNPALDSEKCDWCHANTQPAYISLNGHIDGSVQITSGVGYSESTWVCATACHLAQTPYNMVDTTYPIEPIAGQTITCGSCHAVPPTSGAHTAHNADSDADYTECEACHSNNGGQGYTVANGGGGADSHNNAAVTFNSSVSYSGNGTAGTCTTTNCHNGQTASAPWNTTGDLACDACHYYNVAVPGSPSAAANSTYNPSLSVTHNAHFNATFGACTYCHGVTPTTTAHISSTSGTTTAWF